MLSDRNRIKRLKMGVLRTILVAAVPPQMRDRTWLPGRTVTATAITAVGMGILAGCGSGAPATTDVRGTVTMLDNTGNFAAPYPTGHPTPTQVGDPCDTLDATDSSAQYLLAGTPITVLDASGKQVGRTVMPARGSASDAGVAISTGYNCNFRFAVHGVPVGNGQYQLKIGSLAPFPFQRQDASNLRVEPFQGTLTNP